MHSVRTNCPVIPIALATATLLMPVAPLSAADYYAGKTLELLVGAPPGGGYDIYARIVGRHLGRHIPGDPTVVVKNMPGAGSAKAAQYISSIAPKDGTSLAGIMPGAIMGPLLDDRTAPMFDPTKVQYVVVPGYVAPQPDILAVAHALRPSAPSIPPEYTESLIEWLQNELRPAPMLSITGISQ